MKPFSIPRERHFHRGRGFRPKIWRRREPSTQDLPHPHVARPVNDSPRILLSEKQRRIHQEATLGRLQVYRSALHRNRTHIPSR